MIKCLSIIAACLFITGCSTYDNKFDCPYGNGLECTSLSTVNKIIDTTSLDEKADLLKGSSEKERVFIYFGDDKPNRLVALD